jgi:ABC-type transport system substrate-binding protein
MVITNHGNIPKTGGVYIEGMLSTDKTDEALSRLTKSSLISLDKDGNIIPGLAEKWEISGDGRVYTFHLKKSLEANALPESFLKNAKVEIPEEKVVKISLTQPYGQLLYFLTQPLFPDGPFIIKSKTKKEIILKANHDYWAGSPYLEEVIFKFYKDKGEIERALSKGEIQGAVDVDNINKDKFNLYEMKLPRWPVLFFNLRKSALQDKTLRQKLAKGEKIDKAITLNLVTNSAPWCKELAEKIKSQFEGQGVKINVEYKNSIELQKQIIAPRNFDLLLYGLDYAPDLDPMPFWHSSQVDEPGKNLSGFKNRQADKWLEDARLTSDEIFRQQRYQQFQKLLQDEVPAIFYDQISENYVISKKIKGVEMGFGMNLADHFRTIEKWYIKSGRK